MILYLVWVWLFRLSRSLTKRSHLHWLEDTDNQSIFTTDNDIWCRNSWHFDILHRERFNTLLVDRCLNSSKKTQGYTENIYICQGERTCEKLPREPFTSFITVLHKGNVVHSPKSYFAFETQSSSFYCTFDNLLFSIYKFFFRVWGSQGLLLILDTWIFSLFNTVFGMSWVILKI